MKQFKNALVLGRFQMLHKGHEDIINKALELADKVLVFIGSADKENVEDNPFSYEIRYKMLNEIYGDKIIIKPLNDLGVGNVFAWGDYVIKNAKEYIESVDLIVEGIEAKCELWFSDELKKEISFKKVDRNIIDVSATKLRDLMYNNDYNEWKKWVNPKLHKYYSMLRIYLMKAYVIPTKPRIILDDED